jgi:hypothetical protein
MLHKVAEGRGLQLGSHAIVHGLKSSTLDSGFLPNKVVTPAGGRYRVRPRGPPQAAAGTTGAQLIVMILREFSVDVVWHEQYRWGAGASAPGRLVPPPHCTDHAA